MLMRQSIGGTSKSAIQHTIECLLSLYLMVFEVFVASAAMGWPAIAVGQGPVVGPLWAPCEAIIG